MDASADSAQLTPAQSFGLMSETETAIKLVEAGLRELARIDGANDHVHLHMLLLASGFERLLKLTVALHSLATTGQLPATADIRSYGHDVRRLTDEYVTIASSDPEFAARPACAKDIEFVRTHGTLQDVVRALTVFAPRGPNPGRYHDLELFLEGRQNDAADPKRVWDDIESAILRKHPEMASKLGTPDFQEFYPVLASDLTYVIDRYARAIVRFWTLGSLGEPAQRMTGLIKSFLFIRDSELGQVRR